MTDQTKTTAGVRDWHAPDGSWLGAVVHHPRIEGYWMALWRAVDHRDCGMKRYKTWKGACALVEKKIAAASKIPVDVSGKSDI